MKKSVAKKTTSKAVKAAPAKAKTGIWENFAGAERELVQKVVAHATELDRIFAAHVIDGVTVPDYDVKSAGLINEISLAAGALAKTGVDIVVMPNKGKPFKPPHFEYSDRDLADRSPRQYFYSLFRRAVDLKLNSGKGAFFLPELVITRPERPGTPFGAWHLIPLDND